MNPDQAYWGGVLGRVAVEGWLVVLVAAVVARGVRRAASRAGVWKAALAGLGVVLAAEAAGTRSWWGGVWRREGSFSWKGVTARAWVQPAGGPEPSGNRGGTPGSGDRPDTGTKAGPLWWPLDLWAAGTVLLLARSIGARGWLARRCRRLPVGPAATTTMVAELEARFGVARIGVRQGSGASSPFAVGGWRPCIVVPEGFEGRFREPQRRAMLAHEVAHLAARDPFWLWVGDLVTALGWWHPATWWARARCRAAMESAADAASGWEPGGRLALAEALVALGRELVNGVPGSRLGIAGVGAPSPLAGRVRALLASDETWARPRPARIPALAAALGVFGGLHLVPDGGTRSSAPLGLLMARASALSESGPAKRDAAPAAGLVSELAPPAVPVVGGPAPVAPGVGAVATNGPAATIEVRFLHLDEEGPRGLGLDWLFGQAPTNDVAATVEVPTGDLPGAASKDAENFRVRRQRLEGQVVALAEAQVRQLLAGLERRGGAELLAAPRLMLPSGVTGMVQINDARTVVSGVDVRPPDGDSREPSVQYRTEVVTVGPMVEVRAEREAAGWRLEVKGRLTEMLGYEDPGRPRADGTPPIATTPVAVREGEPVAFQRPHPHLQVREVNGTGVVPSGSSLLLRGGTAEDGARAKGSGADGKHRRRLYILVTPMEAKAG